MSKLAVLQTFATLNFCNVDVPKQEAVSEVAGDAATTGMGAAAAANEAAQAAGAAEEEGEGHVHDEAAMSALTPQQERGSTENTSRAGNVGGGGEGNQAVRLGKKNRGLCLLKAYSITMDVVVLCFYLCIFCIMLVW